ncbi:MAG: hypothetical protein BWX64_00148 [Acidobacteria bacterium ADurb.Bin051]|jgi:hypothetical protein|nr:MAG: hypothetical protein BWX64_00148 [Acidobacteria bacterium ADurb.Bin051]
MDLPAIPLSRLCVLHIGGYWRGVNDMVRMMMLGLAQTGATVVEFDTDRQREALDTEGSVYDRGTTGPVWLRPEVVLPAIEAASPHLIVCNAGGLGFRPEIAAQLRRQHCLVGIALSDPDVFEPSTRHIAPHFDRFFTLSAECLPRYRAIGANAELLRLATNDEFYRPVPSRPELLCDVTMLGRAHPDRVEPVRALAAAFNLHLYGEFWEEHGIASRGFVFGDELLAVLASARTTVVFNRTSGGFRLVKVQLFDFLAAGALVFTNHDSELADYFRLGEELAVFRTTEELLALVGRARAEPEWAATLRHAGRARVLAEHTWRRVWPEVLMCLRGKNQRKRWWTRLAADLLPSGRRRGSFSGRNR